MAKKVVITKAIADKVVGLDCSLEDNIRRLEKSLMKLPFIKNESDLETDNIDMLINKIEAKHDLILSYLMKYNHSNSVHIWTGMIRGKSGVWVTTVYGKTLREALQKALFYMYYHIESEKEKINE